MKCSSCGKEIRDGATFCTNCGTPVEAAPKAEPVPAEVPAPVAEVVEPVADVPPPKPTGTLFGNVSRNNLSALEEAARRELAAAKRHRVPFGMFGGKK